MSDDKHPWSRPAAKAFPKGGYEKGKVEQGRYGPIYPRSPTCYGFGETLFQVFTVMATRRLQADRFFTNDFRAEVYTPEGMAWIADTSMKGILLRHYPELASTGLGGVANAFYPWK